MTQPIQSLQRFQKKYMKITFKKSVLWGRRETELREKKRKKKKTLLQGDTKNYKIVEQCSVSIGHWGLSFMWTANSCQDAQGSQWLFRLEELRDHLICYLWAVMFYYYLQFLGGIALTSVQPHAPGSQYMPITIRDLIKQWQWLVYPTCSVSQEPSWALVLASTPRRDGCEDGGGDDDYYVHMWGRGE